MEGGRIQDWPGNQLKTALRDIARFHTGDFRLTGNQNLILANVAPEYQLSIQAILPENGVPVEVNEVHTGLRREHWRA